jgi:hypothetical protein
MRSSAVADTEGTWDGRLDGVVSTLDAGLGASLGASLGTGADVGGWLAVFPAGESVVDVVGGSIVLVDQDAQPTVRSVMKQLRGGRPHFHAPRANVVLAAVMALAEG